MMQQIVLEAAPYYAMQRMDSAEAIISACIVTMQPD